MSPCQQYKNNSKSCALGVRLLEPVIAWLDRIEARQRLTPTFIENVQRDCLERLDATRSPEAVLRHLEKAIERLHAGNVTIEELIERNRVSKPLEGYTQNTQNVAALKRARDQDLAIHPGQDIEYVVVDNEKTS